MTDPDLAAALALTGPEATLKLYRDWAASYDSGFADSMDYRLPAHVAGAFLAAGGTGPVLDVGAGTGLLALRLREMGFQGQIDALDLSTEMLAKAASKGLYRALIAADVTKTLPTTEAYRGVTSSGTFTAGHVGPEAFPPLLAAVAPGAQFALSVNRRVWDSLRFPAALDGLLAKGLIRDLQTLDVQVYGERAAALDPDHAADQAAVVLFRKA
jgi:predicted TPR repeat methyltransferase